MTSRPGSGLVSLKVRAATAILLAGLVCLQPPAAAAIDLSNTEWERIGREKNIDPQLLFAVALVESSKSVGKGLVSPYAWAVRDATGAHYCASLQEAKQLLKDPRANTDVGLMQINLYWNGNRVKDPSDLLEPDTNIRVGADILIEALKSAPNDLVLGLGRYHRPDDDQIARIYGRRVMQTWHNLIKLRRSV